MRCVRRAALDCPAPERCELEGCPAAAFGAETQALVRERQPIDLPALEDYQPGRLLRGLMALADRGEKAVRRGPTPFAARPEEPPMSISHATLNPTPEPAPPKPTAPTTPDELRVVSIPGGWIVYRGAHPVAVASDPASLGARVTDLVRR
jgi:hypothetical protein